MGIRQSLYRRSVGLVLLLGALGMVMSACSPVVIIPDRALESAIRAELRKPLSLVLTQRNLEELRKLDASHLGVRNIEGLQYSKHLRELNLNNNAIRDINRLGALTNVVKLHLGNNQLMDIEAIAGMMALEFLDLSGAGNVITDWKPLEANVLNLGLGAGSVVVLPKAYTMADDVTPLAIFAEAHDALLQAGVQLVFIN